MDLFFEKLEKKTIKYLTHRKAVKIYEKNHKVKRTFLGELKGWVDALVFAVVVILIVNQYIFQLFVIPSPSMQTTMMVKDRVFVNKNIYGMEIYPGGPKIGSTNRRVHRDDIITFYNPEYVSKGPVFDVMAQVIFMASLSLVNIDRNEDGSVAERLYVKRAVGLDNDTLKFENGDVMIRPSGEKDFVKESDFRANNDLSTGPNRLIDSSYYEGLEAWASLIAYQDKNITQNSLVPTHYATSLQTLTNRDYPRDMYEFQKVVDEVKNKIDPSDFNSRSNYKASANGITVPQGYVLPFGDNRDNSHDGRYFGPVPQEKVNGRVLFRYWPVTRIGYLGNK